MKLNFLQIKSRFTLTFTQIKLLSVLNAANKPMKLKELLLAVHIQTNCFWNNSKFLMESGYIKRVGYGIYIITPKGKQYLKKFIGLEV